MTLPSIPQALKELEDSISTLDAAIEKAARDHLSLKHSKKVLQLAKRLLAMTAPLD